MTIDPISKAGLTPAFRDEIVQPSSFSPARRSSRSSGGTVPFQAPEESSRVNPDDEMTELGRAFSLAVPCTDRSGNGTLLDPVARMDGGRGALIVLCRPGIQRLCATAP